MALTNNISNEITNQEVSIQISLSGLSFCILQKDTQTITTLKHIEFERKLNPFELLEKLKELFEKDNTLQGPFNTVYIIHENELSSLVPKPLFKDDCLADYLKFNSKILKTDFITFDEIILNESMNVYVPYVNINNYIYDKFGEFTFKHFSTVLIENILLLEKNSVDTKVYAHVSTNHFEIIVTKKGGLIFYNTFEYTSKEDFIYYLLFTTEQLQLNPETLDLIFLGNIKKNDELYAIAFTYIRHVSFGNRYDTYNYVENPITNYSDFTLIKNF